MALVYKEWCPLCGSILIVVLVPLPAKEYVIKTSPNLRQHLLDISDTDGSAVALGWESWCERIGVNICEQI